MAVRFKDQYKVDTCRRLLTALAFWLRYEQPQNAQALKDRGKAVGAVLGPKDTFLGLGREEWSGGVIDLLEGLSKKELATIIDFCIRLGKLPKEYEEQVVSVQRALINAYEGMLGETFQVRVGYISPSMTNNDFAVVATNEEVHVNLVKETGGPRSLPTWKLRITGSTGEHETVFDWRKALKFIVNVVKVKV